MFAVRGSTGGWVEEVMGGFPHKLAPGSDAVLEAITNA